MNSESPASCQTIPIEASIVITTRNRRSETLRAIASALAQEGCAFEVLVFDDASEDGTAHAIAHAFPSVRLFHNTVRKGYIHNRSRGFQEAQGRIVFSLDDDAYFSAPDIVQSILRCFDQDRSVAAVAIPYLEPLQVRSRSSLQDPFRASPGHQLRGYIGCAHAVRRDVAITLGGYRDYFIHQGEERDFCLRLMAAGWKIVYGSSDFIVHLVSPKRQSNRINYYGMRNIILFDMLNLPFPHLVIRLLWDPFAAIRYRFSWATLPVKIRGVFAGLYEGIRRRSERRAVPVEVYRRFTRLPSHGPEVLTHEIPPPCQVLLDAAPGDM